MARRFWFIVNCVALVLFVGNFVSLAAACVLGLIRHRGIPVAYFVGLAVTGYLSWMTLQLLRRKLRAQSVENNAPAT